MRDETLSNSWAFLFSLGPQSVGELFNMVLAVANKGKQRRNILGSKRLPSLFLIAEKFFHTLFKNILAKLDFITVTLSQPATITEGDYIKTQAVHVNSRYDTEIDTSLGTHCNVS